MIDEVEALVGPLPAAARRRAGWWTNDPAPAAVHARAWLDAGRQVEAVDLRTGRVRFSVAEWRRGA